MTQQQAVGDNDTSNLPEFTPVSSNQRVKKPFRTPRTTITTVYNSVNLRLQALIEQQAALSSNAGNITNTFCHHSYA